MSLGCTTTASDQRVRARTAWMDVAVVPLAKQVGGSNSALAVGA
jgi:hypothetical protein